MKVEFGYGLNLWQSILYKVSKKYKRKVDDWVENKKQEDED